jgi:preprotein translocase subunit YajC
MNQLFANLPLLMGGSPDGTPGSIVPTLITFGAVFLIFYFLIIRPQQKQKKEQQKMIEAIKKGDRVVTIGGIHGTVQSVKDTEIVLKIDSNTKMTFSRNAVSSVKEASRPVKKAETEPEPEPEESIDDDADNED